MVCIILVEVVWLVEGLIVEFFGYVDCNLLVFDLNIYFISVFDELVKIVQVIKEVGWWWLGLVEEIGGMLVLLLLVWVVNEMIYCVNLLVCFFNLGLVLVQFFYIEGNDE